MVSNTLSVSSVNLILFAARQRGANSQALARAVGLSATQLQDPDGRVPVRVVQHLWREAIAATNEPDLPLLMGELISPASVGVLAYVMMHCPTLGRAFEQLCRYQDIVCDGIRTTRRHEGPDRFALVLHVVSPDITQPQPAINSELSIYYAAIRLLTGQPIPLRELRFAYPRPATTLVHQRAFGPVRCVFDAPESALVLDATALDLPILNANPSLFSLFESHADALLHRLRSPAEAPTTWRVRQEIVALLKGQEPTLASVADRLAVGVRTLQLHLKHEGTTYQQLLDDARRALAERHLREPHLSVTDIAYLLGYSEPSVFSRSFKKWTGTTPGAYRLTTT